MKKAISISLAVLMVLFAASCQSTPPVEDESEIEQEELNNDFERVYNTYRGGLLLEGAGTYEVARGDTLSKIALSRYGAGNGYYFPVIMLASSDVVLDPDLIEPGMLLTIPDLEKNLGDPSARSNIKQFLLDIAEVYQDKGDRRSLTTREHLIALAGEL